MMASFDLRADQSVERAVNIQAVYSFFHPALKIGTTLQKSIVPVKVTF